MGKILDISVVLILLAFVGTGARKGLVMTLERFVSFVGGLIGAHIGASSLKGIVSSKFILPWLSEQINDSGYNPSVKIQYLAAIPLSMFSEQCPEHFIFCRNTRHIMVI